MRRSNYIYIAILTDCFALLLTFAAIQRTFPFGKSRCNSQYEAIAIAAMQIEKDPGKQSDSYYISVTEDAEGWQVGFIKLPLSPDAYFTIIVYRNGDSASLPGK